jgi:hypothetical protein
LIIAAPQSGHDFSPLRSLRRGMVTALQPLQRSQRAGAISPK